MELVIEGLNKLRFQTYMALLINRAKKYWQSL